MDPIVGLSVLALAAVALLVLVLRAAVWTWQRRAPVSRWMRERPEGPP